LLVAEALAELGPQFLAALQQGADGGDRLLQVAADVGGFVEPRLLGHEADRDARGGPDSAEIVLVVAGHGAQQGALAGAVARDDADLGAGEEGEGDVLEDFALVVRLAEPLEGQDVLLGHESSCSLPGWSSSRNNDSG